MRLEDEIKMKKFKSPQHKAGLNIVFTGYWLGSRINTVLKDYDLSEPQYNILRILRGRHPEPANLFILQDRMLSKMSNTTRLVEKLRVKGLVSRDICADNRRKVEICITQAGLDLLKTLDPLVDGQDSEVFGKLSDEEAETLNQLLEKLRS